MCGLRRQRTETLEVSKVAAIIGARRQIRDGLADNLAQGPGMRVYPRIDDELSLDRRHVRRPYIP